MIVVVFRSRLRSEHVEEYRLTAERMDRLVARMPGFLSAKTFSAPDGERVTLAEFESEEAVAAWREQPEHREAQRLGRERFYQEFRLQVCQTLRDYSFNRDAG
jgi:heme-degrading monooxygenase HmoA